jgi:hypothetical protein
MPDGDVFCKSVPRPWIKASRLAFGAKDVGGAAVTSVRTLFRVLTETGCEATSEAIQFVAESLDTVSDLASRRALLRALDQFSGRLPQVHFEALRRVAQRAPFGSLSTFELSVPRGVWEESTLRLGVEFLSELTIMNSASAGLALRLARTGEMNAAGFADQIEQFREQLRNDPGVQSLAGQVIRNPSGFGERSITPRVRRIRRPQRELVEIAIG